jgi:hypothetical protein
MPGENRFADLEPLLERVAKPIQYVGGELNSQVKDWDCGGVGPGGEELTVRWALMYPDAYEVGLPNQGVMILYEVLNERADALAERSYAVWPDLAALMREAGVPQLTVDGHRAVRDFDLFGLSFSTELGYTNMLRRWTWRVSRCIPPTAAMTTRWSSSAATPASTPSRSRTSSTPSSWATASRPCCGSPTWWGPGRPRAGPGGRRRRCWSGWPATGSPTSRRFYRRRVHA